MSIQIGPYIECSACKVPKQTTNHWFRLWLETRPRGQTLRSEAVPLEPPNRVSRIVISELLPEEITTESDLIPGEEHACGDSCLGKLVQRMVAREFGGTETATDHALVGSL